MLTCPHCQKPMDTVDIRFDYHSRVVSCGAKSVKCTPNQLLALEYMIDAYPRGVSEPELYGAMYFGECEADDLPTPDAARVTIHRMKQLFEDANFPVRIGRLRVGGGGAMDYVLVATDTNRASSAA